MPRLADAHRAVLDELRDSVSSGDPVRIALAAEAVNEIADELPAIDAVRTARLLAGR